jgi:D-alanine-D-alanine ligase
MKVALLHNRRPDIHPGDLPDDAFEEFDSEETIEAIRAALSGPGTIVETLVADREFPQKLCQQQYDFVFNIAEGTGGRCREAIPAAICELLGLPFTGSDALTLAVTLDKSTARRIVSPEVPVAAGKLFIRELTEDTLSSLSYPVIVKPNDEGSSKGIREDAIAYDVAAAFGLSRRLRSIYQCPILVEEFLPGTELTVGIAGNYPNLRVLGVMEIAPTLPEPAFVYSLEVKRDWQNRVRYHIPPRLDTSIVPVVEQLALKAFDLLGCRDIARIDFRLDAEGRPRFLECNPLPGLNPESGDIVIMSRNQVPYQQLVRNILQDAAARYGLELP